MLPLELPRDIGEAVRTEVVLELGPPAARAVDKVC